MDMEEKFYLLNHLYKRQRALGLSSGKMWIFRQERSGRLIIRKDPKGWRVVTEKDIEGILKAFSPGGRGYYSWDGSLEASR